MIFRKLYLLTIVLLVTNIGQHQSTVCAQDNPTPQCLASSKDCADFTKCCEAACPTGSTAICQTNTTAAKVHRKRATDTGFMGGGAPEEETAPATTLAPVSSSGVIKISETHCACLEKTRALVSMTISCLSRLNAPDQCPAFEKCCEQACSKNAGHAVSCSQNYDGSPTSDTECSCLNELPNVPGWSELSKNKNGHQQMAAEGDAAEFEDHTIACMNQTDTTCKLFEECCAEMCKNSEKTEAPIKMCAENKKGMVMKSTHTFCRCSKGAAVFSVNLWSDAIGKAGEVSQIFKGGTEYDYDGVADVVPSIIICMVLACVSLVLS